jgi:putative component of membrane protein insertase Oxa1/YidC/SpoIIIJ protein YidD
MTATLALSPLSPLACWLIGLYQRYLSPRKGFCCAYRMRHQRRDSCSQYAKRAISKLGLLPGVRLLRRRFDKCHYASKVLEYETPRPQEKKDQGRRHSFWSNADCTPTPDCGSGCDLPSADACDGLGTAASGVGDAASGCDGAAVCDAGGCDLSI